MNEQLTIYLKDKEGNMLETFSALPCFRVGDTITFRNSKTHKMFLGHIGGIDHNIEHHERTTKHEVVLILDDIYVRTSRFASPTMEKSKMQ